MLRRPQSRKASGYSHSRSPKLHVHILNHSEMKILFVLSYATLAFTFQINFIETEIATSIGDYDRDRVETEEEFSSENDIKSEIRKDDAKDLIQFDFIYDTIIAVGLINFMHAYQGTQSRSDQDVAGNNRSDAGDRFWSRMRSELFHYSSSLVPSYLTRMTKYQEREQDPSECFNTQLCILNDTVQNQLLNSTAQSIENCASAQDACGDYPTGLAGLLALTNDILKCSGPYSQCLYRSISSSKSAIVAPLTVFVLTAAEEFQKSSTPVSTARPTETNSEPDDCRDVFCLFRIVTKELLRSLPYCLNKHSVRHCFIDNNPIAEFIIGMTIDAVNLGKYNLPPPA